MISLLFMMVLGASFAGVYYLLHSVLGVPGPEDAPIPYVISIFVIIAIQCPVFFKLFPSMKRRKSFGDGHRDFYTFDEIYGNSQVQDGEPDCDDDGGDDSDD